jgi:DMSO reductase anchor subunit
MKAGGVRLITPTQQTTWHWPAVVSFVLGGAGSSFYLVIMLVCVCRGVVLTGLQSMVVGMLSLSLIGLGFLALAAEAGRPFRGRYLLGNLRSAWISREVLACIVFFAAVVLNSFFFHTALAAVATLAALGLLLSHSFIVYQARAITAWNVPLVSVVFAASSLVSGAGLALLIGPMVKLPLGLVSASISLICVAVNMVLWFWYLKWSRSAYFKKATQILRRPMALVMVIGFGQLLPLVMLLHLLYGAHMQSGAETSQTAAVLAGMAMVAGGAAQKIGIILQAGARRAIELCWCKTER